MDDPTVRFGSGHRVVELSLRMERSTGCYHLVALHARLSTLMIEDVVTIDGSAPSIDALVEPLEMLYTFATRSTRFETSEHEFAVEVHLDAHGAVRYRFELRSPHFADGVDLKFEVEGDQTDLLPLITQLRNFRDARNAL